MPLTQSARHHQSGANREQSEHEEPSIVAASPVVHESGTLPYRIVIRDLGDQHVVHTQVFEPRKEPWYHQEITSPSDVMCQPPESPMHRSVVEGRVLGRGGETPGGKGGVGWVW